MSSPLPRRILLVRTSAMGDIVHCLPFLTELRRLLPAAEIAWVVEKVWMPILAGHPGIDRLIPVRTKAWRRKPWALRSEFRTSLGEIRDFRADLAFDLMGNFKGACLARLSGAKRIVGASADDRRERMSARFMKETVPTPGVHAVDRTLALLSALGPAPDPSTVDLGGDPLLRDEPPEARAFFDARTAEVPSPRDPDGERPLVLIQCGAGWANKIYPLPRWAEVARELHAAGCDVWLPTAPGEEHLAQRVVELSEGAARSVDATDFRLLAALMRGARLFLGGDTGPVHLAHALGTPVLSIIGPTDPARNGPYAAPERVLFRRLPCSFCYKRFDGPRACLLSIPPRKVVEKALDSLHGKLESGVHGIDDDL